MVVIVCISFHLLTNNNAMEKRQLFISRWTTDPSSMVKSVGVFVTFGWWKKRKKKKNESNEYEFSHLRLKTVKCMLIEIIPIHRSSPISHLAAALSPLAPSKRSGSVQVHLPSHFFYSNRSSCTQMTSGAFVVSQRHRNKVTFIFRIVQKIDGRMNSFWRSFIIFARDCSSPRVRAA